MNATTTTTPGPHGAAPAFSAEIERRADHALKKHAIARSFRLCTGEGLAAMPIVVMAQPVNVVLAALFTKVFHLPTHTIGLIAALPFVCNFLQVFVTPLLARWFPAKQISITCGALHLLCSVALCLMLGLGLLPHDQPERVGLWIGAWFFVSSFFFSITGVTWNAWVQEWVPPRLRGKYFGRRNRLLQFSTLAFLLLAGWVLADRDYSMLAFQLVIAFAALMRLLSIIWQREMPTECGALPAGRAASLSAQWITLRQCTPFLRFIAFGAAWSLAANIFGPFYHVFMFEELHLSAFQVGVLSVCGATGAALSMPAWGALLDRYGNKGVMVVSLILWQTQNFAWSFLTPDNSVWLYAMWFWGGLTNAGFFLGQFTLLLKLLPVPARNLALGVNLAVTSLFAAAAPAVGGLILEFFLARHDALSVYHTAFLAQPLLAIVAGWLLLRIREPAATPLTHVVGAMSNVRTLASLSGVSFLSQYLFYRRAKPSASAPR